jgi:hypothetical protein
MLLKDYLEQQGIFGLIGSRDASRSAFKDGLVTDREGLDGHDQGP